MKHSGIQLPSMRTMLLNGAAILVVGASLSAALRTFLFSPGVAPCSERLTGGARMALGTGTHVLQPTDLQGQLGGTDWNLLGNVRVVRLANGPAPQALEVKTLARPPEDRPGGKPGVGFVWRPDALPASSRSVCLSYQIFLPEGFDFGAGGRLPGLVGGQRNDTVDKEPAFSTRFHFDERGKIDIVSSLPGRNNGRPLGGGYSMALTPGGWTTLEQEVILNTPGAQDGALRIWVNGSLALEKTNLALRKNGDDVVTGVLAEVLLRPRLRSDPKQTAIWMTPFEVRWNGK